MPQMLQVFRVRAIGMLTAGMSTRAVAHELIVHFSTISRLKEFQRIWQYIQPASQPQTTCNHTSPGPPHPASSPPRLWDRSSWKLICMLVILIGVSTWLQLVVVTDLSGQMLTFDGIWHFGEVFSSRINPGFHCTGQMADSVYGVVWVSGLLMSTLWIEWPMVAVGLWYGQTYVMDNEHRCILLMAFWMHKDTMTRSWGPLLCHSSQHEVMPRPSPHVAAW